MSQKPCCFLKLALVVLRFLLCLLRKEETRWVNHQIIHDEYIYTIQKWERLVKVNFCL